LDNRNLHSKVLPNINWLAPKPNRGAILCGFYSQCSDALKRPASAKRVRPATHTSPTQNKRSAEAAKRSTTPTLFRLRCAADSF
jgi:hypothetical protein